jgi:hypothetical protein
MMHKISRPLSNTVKKSFLSLALVSCAGVAQAGLFDGDIRITEIALQGSGCPAGSVTAQVSPNGSSFTVLYDRFILQALANSASPNVGMECKVMLRISKPRLMGFSIESVDFRGFVQLDRGVRGLQKVRVSSGGTDFVRQISADFAFDRWQGPINQNYTLRATRMDGRPPILSCLPVKEETKVEITSLIRLNGVGGGRSGMLTVDSADGRLSQKFNLRWHNCISAGGDLLDQLGGLFGGR